MAKMEIKQKLASKQSKPFSNNILKRSQPISGEKPKLGGCCGKVK
jgi:hypothetical protein